MIHAYARVSTDGQSVEAQVKQLRTAGAERIWRETASAAKTDRAVRSQVKCFARALPAVRARAANEGSSIARSMAAAN